MRVKFESDLVQILKEKYKKKCNLRFVKPEKVSTHLNIGLFVNTFEHGLINSPDIFYIIQTQITINDFMTLASLELIGNVELGFLIFRFLRGGN